jgi:tetratricopeptide (TPR) repeat protein
MRLREKSICSNLPSFEMSTGGLTEAEIARYSELYKAGNELIRGRILLDKVPLTRFVMPWDRWQLRRAVRKFAAAVEIAPRQWQCHFWIGKALQRLGDKRGAFDAFERARTIEPENLSVLKEAANAALECDQPQLAIAFLRPACNAAPADVVLRHNLALALFLLGEIDEARLLAEQVLKVDRDPMTEWLMGKITDVRLGLIRQPKTWQEALDPD